MTEPVIVLDHLSKSLGAVNAVQDLSFIYNRDGNDLWFSWGKWRRQNNHHANALRLGHPASGKATIASYDVWKDRHLARTKFGYVAQRFSLYRDLTVCRASGRSVDHIYRRGLSPKTDRTARLQIRICDQAAIFRRGNDLVLEETMR